MKRYILFLFAISIIQNANALEVTIEGLNYFLYPQNNEATLTYGHTCIGEVDIPSEVSYNGETFVVKSMIWCAFYGNTELTSVKIPKSIESILHDYPYEYDNLHGPFGTVSPLYMNPFMGCTALESIEVNSENPSLKSIDGVLFSQDGVGQYYYKTNNYQGTGLYCYPEGKQKEAYIIPENVEWIGADAFSHNQYLTALTMPNSLKHICQYAFEGCRNLANIYCYADNAPTAGNDIFKDTPIASATLHVPAGSIEEYKATSPWSGFGNIVALPEQYYPEGTKWTEIRLDTLKYDSWYSKVGDSWVPNFETIEYHVEGDYTEKWGDTYKCVFSNDPEWMGTPLLIKETSSDVSVSLIYDEESKGVMSPATVYQFDWNVGKGLYYKDLLDANSTGIVPYYFFYGVIDEIKEGDFGGVRPLKYVDLDGKAPALEFGYCIDTNGGRIIQGIGITEWNDGECLFGPPNPNLAKTLAYGERHYRSMLVHFERDGEVLYDVWPEKEAIEVEPVTFTRDQMATIILPTEPDASKGKYYRLDRCEKAEGQTKGQIVFEQELQPRARVPYIIVPSEDFSIDLSSLDLEGLTKDSVSIEGISFIGSYVRKALPQRGSGEGADSFYIDIIDTTPDCSLSPSGETGQKAVIGALRAYLSVRWDDPIDYGGTRGPQERLEVVLRDHGTSIGQPREEEMVNAKSSNGECFDLCGRKIVNGNRSNGKYPKEIYIEKGRKRVVK